MGVGNFFGLMPESMQNATLMGVELDSITGRLAKQLYPQANITVDGFERVNLPDNPSTWLWETYLLAATSWPIPGTISKTFSFTTTFS